MEELKPMHIGTILDKVFRLTFNKKFFMIFGISCIFFIPLILLRITAAALSSLFLMNLDFMNNMTIVKSIYFIIGLLPLIPLAFFSGIYCDSFYCRIINRNRDIRNSFNSTKKFFKQIIIYLFMLYTIHYFFYNVYDAFITKIILINNYSSFRNIVMYCITISRLVILLIILTFASNVLPIIILENKKILNSISYSSIIIKSHFFRTFGAVTLFYFMIQIALFIIKLPIDLVFIFNDFSEINYKYHIYSNLEYLIRQTFFVFTAGPITAFVLLLYINYKIKHENFGVQLLAENMINNKEGN